MSVDKCVSCGESIPEGRQVCPMCEQLAIEKLNELDLMRERYRAEKAARDAEIARLKEKGYYRTRTVTAFQKIKEVRSHAPVR